MYTQYKIVTYVVSRALGVPVPNKSPSDHDTDHVASLCSFV